MVVWLYFHNWSFYPRRATIVMQLDIYFTRVKCF